MSGPHAADGQEEPVGPDEPVTGASGPAPDGSPGPDDDDLVVQPAAEPAAELDDATVAARWEGIISELADPGDPRSWAPDPDVEEAGNHFVPPDPGPVLGGDPLLTMAWSVVVGVPLLMMLSVVVWRDVPTIVMQTAGVGFVVAVGLLLWRMPRDHEDDAGPGAVV